MEKGHRSQGLGGVPWAATSAVYHRPGAHSVSPFLALILALPPPCL